MASVDIEFVDDESGSAAGEVSESMEQAGDTGANCQADTGTSGGPAAPHDADGASGEGASEESSQEPDADETVKDSSEADGSDAEAPKKARPDKKDEKIAELNDRYLRLFAEFDNFRKRTELEKSQMFADGERTVLLKVLPLIDNFERALGTLSDEERESAFATGIDKVYKAFADQLKELGVTPIEAVGQEFDASYHNAVMHVDDESQPDNTVVEEFQKGYMFKDKVLRYSMVKVAN